MNLSLLPTPPLSHTQWNISQLEIKNKNEILKFSGKLMELGKIMLDEVPELRRQILHLKTNLSLCEALHIESSDVSIHGISTETRGGKGTLGGRQGRNTREGTSRVELR